MPVRSRPFVARSGLGASTVVFCAQVDTTLSAPMVQRAPVLCEVEARPSSNVDPRLIVNVDPAMRFHVVPSADVFAVNVLPARVTLRNTGVVPVGFASFTVVPP